MINIYIVTISIRFVTKEKTVKISKYLLEQIQEFRNKNKLNKINYPSDKNFVDRAVMELLNSEGFTLKND